MKAKQKAQKKTSIFIAIIIEIIEIQKKKPTRIKRETKDCKEKTCTKRERAKRADQTIFAQLIYFKHA